MIRPMIAQGYEFFKNSLLGLIKPLIAQGYEVYPDFDVNDSKFLGRPRYFDTKIASLFLEMLITSDDAQKALKVMHECMPSWFYLDENYPQEWKDIERKLYEQSYDTFLYCNDNDELNYAKHESIAAEQWAGNYCFPRAKIITDEIKSLNDLGLIPWIVDIGASHGNLPFGLKATGCQFDYLGLCTNSKVSDKLKERLDDIWKEKPEEGQVTILVCTEVLEHMWRPEDMVHSAYKLGVDFTQIFLSVPYCTMDGGLPTWRDRPYGHIKSWNEKDLLNFAQSNFKGYDWKQYISTSQVIHGVKR